VSEGPLHAHNRQAARDRARVLREQQGPPLTPDEIRAALGRWADEMGAHVDHGNWHEVGRCVYCGCGARLYQGRLPRKSTR
jgi:hypothetical protein